MKFASARNVARAIRKMADRIEKFAPEKKQESLCDGAYDVWSYCEAPGEPEEAVSDLSEEGLIVLCSDCNGYTWGAVFHAAEGVSLEEIDARLAGRRLNNKNSLRRNGVWESQRIALAQKA